MSARSLLTDVARAYVRAEERYEQAMTRGDFNRADDAFDDMRAIEKCVTVNETSTAWRNEIGKPRQRSSWGRR